MEDKDALLQLKKRARRRLVGAVALAGTAAFVLNMAMDHQSKPETEEVEIRIPGQDEKPFAPRFAAPPAPESQVTTTTLAPSAKPVTSAAKSPADPASKPVETTAKPASKPVEKPAAKPADKAPPAPAKAPEKTVEKPVDKAPDAARAAAILAGKSPESVAATAATQHVILIGAFADPANVKNLQTKLGQLGIKVYIEPLASPQGKKTRVRAGPFQNREDGQKALDKMKRIGVNGVLTTKQ
ncbi:MAG: hypothetical protein H6R18_2223 [Proteobacteria bacterium]|nr:hypothetical protein [Pseudomonadota bacterium]